LSRPRGYPPEFRAEAVRLYRDTDKTLRQVSSDLGISVESLRKWVRQAEIDGGQRDGLTTEEREELRRLKRENKVLREEREILKKAAAFFASEDNLRPRRHSF
jgi:transposase